MAAVTAASRVLWNLVLQLPPHVVRVRRRGDVTVIRGSVAPWAWVAPMLVGVLAYGFVVDLIATHFCWSCAGAGRTWWPPIALGLVALYGRGFTARVGASGAVVDRTFFGVPYARTSGDAITASPLPDGPGQTRGVALSVEGSSRAPLLVGSRRTIDALVGAFQRARSR
jgi:hypothetical protein